MDVHPADVLAILGALLVTAAVSTLAGPGWAMLVLGVFLLAAAVIVGRQPRGEPAAADRQAAEVQRQAEKAANGSSPYLAGAPVPAARPAVLPPGTINTGRRR